MIKLLTIGATFVFGIALLAAQPPADEERGAASPSPLPPPPPRKKADEGPSGDLRRAYELLRRFGRMAAPPVALKNASRNGQERALKLYRDVSMLGRKGMSTRPWSQVRHRPGLSGGTLRKMRRCTRGTRATSRLLPNGNPGPTRNGSGPTSDVARPAP